jgi:hypothetical protein
MLQVSTVASIDSRISGEEIKKKLDIIIIIIITITIIISI